VKHRILLAAVVPMALLSLLPAVEAGAELGPPAEAGGGTEGNGFHGFAQFETHAQSQVATATGFLNAFREDNSIVGAVSEINGPPATSRNITALVFRGRAVVFVYGVVGGGGGERGTLPDPPPGEANAYYPTEPLEMTWSGPITGLGLPQVLDSRFHAKATKTPTGRTEGAVTALESPNHFKVGQATVVSHTEPADGGIVAEAVSVMHQVEVGPLLIQNIVSRAYTFVPTSGEPKGIASTVVEGAKVGETPVQVTDKGIVVADNVNPLQQEQVNKAMADAGYPEVRLLPSVAKAGEDGSSVDAAAGTLSFVKHDESLGASNPQGVAGGGFSIGGAEAFVRTQRCSPDCGSGTSSDSSGDTGSSPLSNGTSSDGAPAPSYVESGGAGGYGADSSSSTLTTDTSGAGLSDPGLSPTANRSNGGSDSSVSLGYANGASGSTIAVTPPATTNGAGSGTGGISTETATGAGTVSGGAQVAAGVPVQQAAAFTELGPKSAEWLRDLYLMAGLALGIIFVGQRLARAFS
jgi:hypothetical protein